MADFQSASEQFLTPEECAEVDMAMMTSRDRFSARVAIYSLRSLKQISQQYEQPIADLNPQQITQWVEQDPSLRPEHGFDTSFKNFFSKLVISSLNPLTQIASEAEIAIEQLTVPQVVSWFEKVAKQRIEQGEGS
jgi:hypothetical protein